MGVSSEVAFSFIVQLPKGIMECTRDTSFFSKYRMYLREEESVILLYCNHVIIEDPDANPDAAQGPGIYGGGYLA